MKKIFSQKYLLTFFLIFSSCGFSDNQETKIRIVDLQGRPRQVITRTPDLNSQAMFMQQSETKLKQIPQSQDSSSAQENPKDKIARNKYANQTDDAVAIAQQEAGQNPYTKEQKQNPAANADKNSSIAGLSEAGVASQNKTQEITYDLSSPEEEKPAMKEVEFEKVKAEKSGAANKSRKKSSAVAAVSAGETTGQKGYFVQVGSFGNAEGAKESLRVMGKFHKGKVEEAQTSSATVYRALLGPFHKKPQALAMMNKIKNSGHDAIIVKRK